MSLSAASEGRFGAAFVSLGVERAWSRSRGAGVLIAIVDEGVQLDHPLLAPNIVRHQRHDAAEPGEQEIHGTHAAGVAAGRASEIDRFAGVAPEARILAVNFSPDGGPRALRLPDAIECAAELRAAIVYLAPGKAVPTPALARALQYAAARNVLVVSPARDGFPLCGVAQRDDPLPNWLGVRAVDGRHSPLSSCLASAAHLAAPGYARVPRWRASGHVQVRDDCVGAAYVAGCAALVKAINPAWGYHEIKEQLLASATPVAALTAHCRQGRLLHIGNAVCGPLEQLDDAPRLAWSSLFGATVRWRLRYPCPYCATVVATYRREGESEWRELASAPAAQGVLSIPAAALAPSSGVMRLACREGGFQGEPVPVTIR